MSARKTTLVVPKPEGYAEELVRHGFTTIRKGERVKVSGTDRPIHDGFYAAFDHVFVDKGGLCVAVREMFSRTSDEFVQWRFVKPDRISRKRVQE